ncbi:hypothetical protein FHS01_003623 [Longimicrobium terrae]|uniref:Uncharacterized protein n=1 Tax=Longimicrobium terrae TaxID=1639882 RepID=A0A841H1U3_9BACT|nr:hypothetical protein [Longimicrobium terrae]MBB6071963.1 hypothetical protein [Longimicrobium terrae]
METGFGAVAGGGPHPACCARRPSPTNGCGRGSTPQIGFLRMVLCRRMAGRPLPRPVPVQTAARRGENGRSVRYGWCSRPERGLRAVRVGGCRPAVETAPRKTRSPPPRTAPPTNLLVPIAVEAPNRARQRPVSGLCASGAADSSAPEAVRRAETPRAATNSPPPNPPPVFFGGGWAGGAGPGGGRPELRHPRRARVLARRKTNGGASAEAPPLVIHPPRDQSGRVPPTAGSPLLSPPRS